MNPYRKVTSEEYCEIKGTWGCTDAYFWHACDDDGCPRERVHNNYRRGVVYRNGNDLYFLANGGPYVLPKHEYKFIEGDVNVNLSYLDIETRNRYFGDGGIRAYAVKLGCNPSEVEGAPTFAEFLDIHATEDAICEEPEHPVDDFKETEPEIHDEPVEEHVEDDSVPKVIPSEPASTKIDAIDAANSVIAPEPPKTDVQGVILALLASILAPVARFIDLFLGSEPASAVSDDKGGSDAVSASNFTLVEQKSTICGMSREYIATLVAEGGKSRAKDTYQQRQFKIAA